MILRCRDRVLSLAGPQVMGVLNVTPDSFSDGGSATDLSRAIEKAEMMVAAGAAIIDVGGESTRPGAELVPVAEELRRVVPVVDALCQHLDTIVSVDTRKPEVMRAALAAGAHMINDVSALQSAEALALLVESEAAVCLMHMQGEPASMQQTPTYTDVVAEVRSFLAARITSVTGAGISLDRILVDPGFGFGKSLQHNLRLLKELAQLTDLGCPLLVGLSRKSMLGELLNVPPLERLNGSLAAAALAVSAGARVVRSHDVGATVEALRVVDGVLEA